MREIDNLLYSRKALTVTRDVYLPYCDIQVLPLTNNRARVSLTIKSEYSEDSRQIVCEFWNYFLECSCKNNLESD